MNFRRLFGFVLAVGLGLGAGHVVAEIENSATASATYGDVTVTSLVSTATVPVAAPFPALRVTKSDDTSAFSDPVQAGDILTYVFTVENTGNVTLQNVVLTDTALSLVDAPAFVSADKGSTHGVLKVGEIATYTADYIITQSDIDTGEVLNWADATSEGPRENLIATDLSDDPKDDTDLDRDGNGDADDVTRTELAQVPVLTLEKISPSFEQVFPYVYDIKYRISAKNSGNQTLNDVMVTDDLMASLQPGVIVGVEALDVSGFDGSIFKNENFDGVNDTNLINQSATLQPDQSGLIDMIVRVDFSDGIAENGNVAIATAAELGSAVESSDPTEFSNVVDPDHPGNPVDPTLNLPTPHHIQDLDFDGAPDSSETEGDRDGDGIPNNVDYDPHGVFYCQENGKILQGGLITVTGPNGSQTGIGNSNNIRIVRDGSDGVYQWFTTAPGVYSMTYQLPAGGVASQDRFSLGTLDSSLLMTDPYSVGSSEFGNTNTLADFTAAANPFYKIFDIQAGSPVILNNNIPLQFCGTPGLAASKSIVGDVIMGSDLRSHLTYEIVLSNVGDVRIEHPTISDDLDATFGAGTYEITSRKLISSSAAFTGVLNPDFDGSRDTAVLSTAGYIEPAETITVQLSLAVKAPRANTYVNTAEISGTSPLTGDVLDSEFASVSVDLFPSPSKNSIVVTKTAAVGSVMLGGAVPYTLTFENTNAVDITDVAFVDQLPGGFVYKPKTARLDGQSVEPSFEGRRLIWPNQTLAANTKVTIELVALAGAGIDGTSFVNKTWVEDLATGTIISQVASAEVQREAEAIFECSDVIGTVFDDQNYNGYQDGPRSMNGAEIAGETGLAGVRISTTTGTLISTDTQGRFNVPCAATPDALGDNVILKLDTRSLPEGYVVITENPRSVRLTAGKMAKLNFGAALGRELEVDLSARAFDDSGTTMKPALEDGLMQMLDLAETSPSVFMVTYFENGEGVNISNERLQSVETFIKREWAKRDSIFDLNIETSVKSLQ